MVGDGDGGGGGVVRAVAAYAAQSDTELSVEEGALLWVIDASDAEWTEAKHTISNATGFIPTSYVVQVPTHPSRLLRVPRSPLTCMRALSVRCRPRPWVRR
jgi:hypothetical protein